MRGYTQLLDGKVLSSSAQLGEVLSELRGRFNLGDGKAAYWLSIIYSPYSTVLDSALRQELPVSEEVSASFALDAFRLLSEMETKDAETLNLLATYYQSGNPPLHAADLSVWESLKRRACELGSEVDCLDLFQYYLSHGLNREAADLKCAFPCIDALD